MNTYERISPHYLTLILAVGASLGILVVADPYITNTVSSFLPVYIEGINLLKLFPFELSVLAISALAFLLFLYVHSEYLCDHIILNFEKIFIILFLFGQATIALHGATKIDLSEIFLIFFFLTYLARVFLTNEKIVLTKLDAINLLFCIFVLLSVINTPPMTFVLSVVTLTKFTIIIFLLSNLVYKKNIVEFTIKCFILVTMMSALIAILQEIVFLTTGIKLIGVMEKEYEKFMYQVTAYGTFLRTPAFFDKYKIFSFYLVSAMVLIVNKMLYGTITNIKGKMYYTFCLVVMAIGLALTFSQDALLALGIAIALSILIRWPFLIIYSFVFCVLTVVAMYILGYLDDIIDAFVAEVKFGEIRVRLQLLREGLQGFSRHPWIGVGQSYGYRYTNHFYDWPVHNSLVQAANETGIFGFLTFSLLIGYVLFHIFRLNLLATANEGNTATLRGLLLLFIAHLISIQFHPMYLERTTWLYMGLIQGAVLIEDRGSV